MSRNGDIMKQLSSISYGITALGILLIVAAVIADLGATWMLCGVLLALAGVVKIAVVHIWQRVAGL